MTTQAQALTPAEIKALDIIQKLLNLAAKAGTPEEAASANAKAQELLAKHKLDAALVERASGGSGQREDAAPPAARDAFSWAFAWALAR
ncbi:MAG: DUF2786 domain-containing protein [Stellaceae bacterium]